MAADIDPAVKAAILKAYSQLPREDWPQARLFDGGRTPMIRPQDLIQVEPPPPTPPNLFMWTVTIRRPRDGYPLGRPAGLQEEGS